MNLLVITGNLVADAETRYLPDGKAVCGFKIANNQGYGDKEHTEYYDCSLWGKRAEGGLVPLLTKGTKVTVYGEHRTEEREHNGKTYFNNKVFVRDVELGGRSNDGQMGNQEPKPQNQAAQPQAPEPSNDFDSKIPF